MCYLNSASSSELQGVDSPEDGSKISYGNDDFSKGVSTHNNSLLDRSRRWGTNSDNEIKVPPFS